MPRPTEIDAQEINLIKTAEDGLYQIIEAWIEYWAARNEPCMYFKMADYLIGLIWVLLSPLLQNVPAADQHEYLDVCKDVLEKQYRKAEQEGLFKNTTIQ